MERYFILIHHLENPTKDLDYDVIKIIFNMKTTKIRSCSFLNSFISFCECEGERLRFLRFEGASSLFLARWLRLGKKSAMLLGTLKE